MTVYSVILSLAPHWNSSMTRILQLPHYISCDFYPEAASTTYIQRLLTTCYTRAWYASCVL